MIYFLYLAWVLAVRRDTQGNQWNVQTCRTVCNERVRRTDAMMRCHRRYAIAMAHLFPVIRNKSGAWSSGRECLRSEETHRTPSYLPISTIFHSATMGQSEHKIPIFLSSVEVITGGNLLKLCIIRQRFPALVCWKPKLHLDVSTTESEIQSLVEIGLSIFFTASTSHLSSHCAISWTRNSYAWDSSPKSLPMFTRTLTSGPLTSSLFRCSAGASDDVAAGSDSEKLRSAMTEELRLWGNHPAIGSEQKSYTTGRTVTLQ